MTLHRTIILIHDFVKWSLIIGGIGFSLFMLFNIGRIIYGILYPPAPELPNVKFGKLAPVVFPESTVTDDLSYSIETLSGTLPSFGNQVNVYKIIPPKVSLLNVKTAREKVAQVEFKDIPLNKYRELAISPSKYQWQIIKNDLLRTIVVETNTYDFKVSSSYRTYPPLINQVSNQNEEDAKDRIDEFLNKMALPTDDIDREKSDTRLLRLNKGFLVTAESLAATQIIRVDLFQKNIDKKPVYYPYHPYSSMYFFVMASGSSSESILEASYVHQIASEEFGTYPLKTTEEAFEELKAGKGFIANYFGDSTSVPITDVTLGYYIGDTRQAHTIPIIVFQSKDKFYAFVPAVKEACLTTSSATLDDCKGVVKKK